VLIISNQRIFTQNDTYKKSGQNKSWLASGSCDRASLT